MPSSNVPSAPPPSSPHERAVQEVLTRFDAYARIRAVRDSIIGAPQVGPREEERAFDGLRQAVARLRATAR